MDTVSYLKMQQFYIYNLEFYVEAEDELYKSLNIDWGIDDPVLSDKDLNLNLFDKNIQYGIEKI